MERVNGVSELLVEIINDRCRMRRISESVMFQVFMAVLCSWYLSAPVSPNTVRRPAGEI